MKNQYVLLFNTIYPQIIGGMEIYNYYLSQHLLSSEFSNIIMLNSDKRRVDNNKIFLIRNRCFGITRWGLGMLSVFLSCLMSRHICIRRWKTLMIPYTSNFEYNAWPVIFFSWLFGFKYVIHCHGGGVKEWHTPKLQKKLFDKARYVTAVSDKIIKEYYSRTGSKIVYLPPLMDYKKSAFSKEEVKNKFGIGKYDKIILYVGSLKPLKSPETLLKAFSSLPNSYVKGNKVGLVMAGGGELLEELQTKYSSNDHIHILGPVKNETIKDLYAAADIYVICSWFEGTPLSLMEAMFNGLCCIGTRVQGIDSIIENETNGMLFPKDDHKSLRGILEKCLEDDVFAKRVGKEAEKYYHLHYSYNEHIKQVLDLLDYKRSN